MKISLAELERRVIDTAVYSVCGSGSITASCRADAAVLVLVWAQVTGGQEFDKEDIDKKMEEAYRYFEFSEPEPSWAVWTGKIFVTEHASPSV